MIIIDHALEQREKEGNPIRVAMVGAGFMGKGITLQFLTAAKGMHLVAICNRTLDKAVEAYKQAGAQNIKEVYLQRELDESIRDGVFCITTDPFLLCESPHIDVIIEVTGTINYGAAVALSAIRNQKHVVLMNAELDGTAGPILKHYADQHGVVFTNADGDQPGVLMNLYRFVKGIGAKPLLCGNIKGLHDPYRTPATQKQFAKKWGQNPSMVTSFADGSKISFEQALIANATGMKVGRRGMYGPAVKPGTPLEESIKLFPDHLLATKGGVVDYIVGASPSPGVFVIGSHNNLQQQHYLHLYKMGKGPFYCFYRPYHLCHFEVPASVARAVLFGDATIASRGGPVVEVVTIAKTDLKTGQTLDGIGHYMTYGVCENADIVTAENLLPLGVAEGCILKKPVAKDQALTYSDVEIPADRLIDQLRAQQYQHFQASAFA